MLQKTKNIIITISTGIIMYFYCLLTFDILPNIETIKNTKDNIQIAEYVEPIEIIEIEPLLEEKSVETIPIVVSTNGNEWINSTVTAYCACMECCGKTNGITASGTKATAGRTIAMSKDYKFGTKIEIEGYGVYIVEDRGGAIKNTRIDIYFDTHKEALQFGKKQLRFRIVE